MNERIRSLLSAKEQSILGIAEFGLKAGFGRRPAIIVIDAQNYMVGPREGATREFPSACGEAAVHALETLAPVLNIARSRGVPVIYSRFVLKRAGSDVGQYARKRTFRVIEGWAIEGTVGAEISALVAPCDGDLVLDKVKPSAFFGTPLLSLLIDRAIDTLLVAGGSTSNCVRATVVDAFSYNYRPVVIEDCVFDRFDISHRVALFDLQRQYADVCSAELVKQYLAALNH